MTTEGFTGTCGFCSEAVAKAQMTRHLKGCPKREADRPGEGGRVFHVAVEAAGAPEYWLHVEVNEEATFKALDRLLRNVWLECCGHMSAFRSRDGDIGMSRKVGSLLRRGLKLNYEYDFGSTTELVLKVMGERPGRLSGSPVQILSRNDPPRILCGSCGKAPAKQVCGNGCGYSESGWLCGSCAEHHACGEDMLLPVVNSPRAGVCGYTG
jgi:hypothetical protein